MAQCSNTRFMYKDHFVDNKQKEVLPSEHITDSCSPIQCLKCKIKIITSVRQGADSCKVPPVLMISYTNAESLDTWDCSICL